jgi:hypothetical protein
MQFTGTEAVRHLGVHDAYVVPEEIEDRPIADARSVQGGATPGLPARRSIVVE